MNSWPAMDRVREIASSGLGLRKAQKLRVRLPLARLSVVSADSAALAAFVPILCDELNVKQVELVTFEDDSLERFGIGRKLTVNARVLGPRIGKRVQAVIKAARSGDWVQNGDGVTVGGVDLLPAEFDLELQADDPANAIAFLDGGGFVLLDTVTTPELEAEGLARDVIRAVQDTRKAAGLRVSDRIRLSIIGDSAADVEALSAFGETIGAETLSLSTSISLAPDAATAAALGSAAGSERATLEAGKFSNAGDLVIDVWKSEARKTEVVDV